MPFFFLRSFILVNVLAAAHNVKKEKRLEHQNSARTESK
jgi:hypothetical protein